MNSIISTACRQGLGIPLIWQLRDFFLLPVKLGDTLYCRKLQEKADAIAKRMGVQIPITVSEHPSFPFMAHGTVLHGRGGITVPANEWKKNNPAINAILAHEIAHIKHNDGLIWACLVTVSYVALNILFTCMTGVPWVGDLMGGLGALLTLSISSIKREEAADAEALKHITDADKKAFIHLLKREIETNKWVWKDAENEPFYSRFFTRLLVNSEGEYLLNSLTHPTHANRIKTWEASLTKKPTTLWGKVFG
jgi:hypothetical protein